MATRDEILRKLGTKMLAEIDHLLRRFFEEKSALLQASTRIAEIDAEVAVLEEERARLVGRGQSAKNLFAQPEDNADDPRTGLARAQAAGTSNPARS